MNEWLTGEWEGFRSKELQRPDPVGAKRIKTLRLLRIGDIPWDHAEAQFGALYRMGYVRRDGDKAQITNAGLAVLERHERGVTIQHNPSVLDNSACTAVDPELSSGGANLTHGTNVPINGGER